MQRSRDARHLVLLDGFINELLMGVVRKSGRGSVTVKETSAQLHWAWRLSRLCGLVDVFDKDLAGAEPGAGFETPNPLPPCARVPRTVAQRRVEAQQ